MNTASIWYLPTFDLEFEDAEVSLIEGLASRHYDHKCRALTGPDAWLGSLLKRRELRAVEPTIRLTATLRWRDLDLFGKVMEMSGYLQDPQERALARAMQRSVVSLLREHQGYDKMEAQRGTVEPHQMTNAQLTEMAETLRNALSGEPEELHGAVILAALKQVVAHERERCAKIAEERDKWSESTEEQIGNGSPDAYCGYGYACQEIAKRIRSDKGSGNLTRDLPDEPSEGRDGEG